MFSRSLSTASNSIDVYTYSCVQRILLCVRLVYGVLQHILLCVRLVYGVVQHILLCFRLVYGVVQQTHIVVCSSCVWCCPTHILLGFLFCFSSSCVFNVSSLSGFWIAPMVSLTSISKGDGYWCLATLSTLL